MRLLFVFSTVWATFLCSPARADEQYPNGRLLVEPSAMASPIESKGFVVLDARDKKKYLDGHIPTARWVDHAEWAKSFGEGSDADGWGKRIGALGVTANSKVVVYDDAFSRDAARIWWILRYWGVRDVRILNGGWKGWTAGNHPTDKHETSVPAVAFTAMNHPDRFASKSELLEAVQSGGLQIVDARSENEFCGVEKMNNKRAGAMPGAKQLEWIALIDKPTQRFKSAAELKKLFADAGIELDRPTAAHCQSGGRAAVMAFGLELMGAKEVKNYYRSWSEWGNDDDTPIVKPLPKKK